MLLTATGSYSQNVDDALRYSQVFYNGTARFMSMSGAFTALGGDLSTLSQNPAGLAVFRSSEISISPQLFNYRSLTSFNNNNSRDYLYNFNLSQAGIALNLINRKTETGLINLNFGYSFNRTNNLNQSIVIEGISNNNTQSMADYWAYMSEGHTKADLASSGKLYDAFLANQVWVIDTLSGISDSYGTIYSDWGDSLPSIYGQTIKRIITSDGYTGEHAISIAGNFSNKLFLGLTLGISKLNYESKYAHLEATDKDLPSKYTDFVYNYYMLDKGTGYSLKLGAIFRPIEPLRIGLAFHSPTYYKIDEYVHDDITAHQTGNYIPTASNYPTRYSYALTTPFRVIVGVAYQLKKLAIFSAEYEFADYGMAKFSETGDNYNYTGKNDTIKSTLGSVHNLRIGTEVRLGKLYLRGGYSYYGKAYKKGDISDNIDYDSFSAGVGFREQNIYIDFGYAGLINPQKYILYQYGTDPGVVTAMSSMTIHRNMFTVTFGYKFGY